MFYTQVIRAKAAKTGRACHDVTFNMSFVTVLFRHFLCHCIESIGCSPLCTEYCSSFVETNVTFRELFQRRISRLQSNIFPLRISMCFFHVWDYFTWDYIVFSKFILRKVFNMVSLKLFNNHNSNFFSIFFLGIQHHSKSFYDSIFVI